MQTLEIPNPLNGAAYQILYERFLPHLAATRERQAEILTGFAEVTFWAKTQPPHVRKSYAWAIDMLTKQMERQIGGHEMGNKVIAALETIPRPPA